MKTLKIDVNALMTDVKAIGNIDVPEHGPLCLVSEKNLINVLKTLGTIPASDLAINIARRLKNESVANDFTTVMLQNIMNDELEFIEFAVDCGELLVGDDSKIKEYLSSESKREYPHE